MDFKRTLLPAVAGIMLFMACKSKPTDPIPTAPPAAIKPGDPHRVLEHMRYIAVRKDLKHIPVFSVSGIDPNVVAYENIVGLHFIAGDMNASLTAEEIKQFGLEDLQNLGILAANVSKKELTQASDKLAAGQLKALPPEMNGLNLNVVDQFPAQADKARAAELEVVKSRLAAIGDAGVYRIAKAMPELLWRKGTLGKVVPRPGTAFTDVYFNVGEKPVLKIVMAPRKDGNLGFGNAQYLVAGTTLKNMEQQLKAAEGK